MNWGSLSEKACYDIIQLKYSLKSDTCRPPHSTKRCCAALPLQAGHCPRIAAGNRQS